MASAIPSEATAASDSRPSALSVSKASGAEAQNRSVVLACAVSSTY